MPCQSEITRQNSHKRNALCLLLFLFLFPLWPWLFPLFPHFVAMWERNEKLITCGFLPCGHTHRPPGGRGRGENSNGNGSESESGKAKVNTQPEALEDLPKIRHKLEFSFLRLLPSFASSASVSASHFIRSRRNWNLKNPQNATFSPVFYSLCPLTPFFRFEFVPWNHLQFDILKKLLCRVDN